MARERPPGFVASKPRLTVLPLPEPFVLPLVAADDRSGFQVPAVEVVLISSPAAVGKSTVARYLSAKSNAPVLDLSETKVSTHALAGFFGPELSAEDAHQFHAGRLPLIIDALDEGQVNSGIPNLEQFLSTAWEYLLTDRSVTTRPKLVMFGRDEVMDDLVTCSLQADGEGVSSARLRLDFFDHAGAVELVCRQGAFRNPQWEMRRADREALEALFTAIEAALGLATGALWDSPRGRAFAGYAPILMTFGEILAVETTNAVELRNMLLDTRGTREAWAVLRRVIDYILDREREDKFLKSLHGKVQADVPPEAYDRRRQLTYVVQYVTKQQYDFSDVPMVGPDGVAYREAVRISLPGHPFIKSHNFVNEVPAGFALAQGIVEEVVDISYPQLREASRQPFLWRSFRDLVSEQDITIDGCYLGCLLNSLWTEPEADSSRVTLSAVDELETTVVVRLPLGGSVTFNALGSLQLYGQVRATRAHVMSPVEWHSELGGGVLPCFSLRGDVMFVCDDLMIGTSTMRNEGKLWLCADELHQPPHLELLGSFDCVWLAGAFAHRFPWRNYPSTLPPPDEGEPPESSSLLDRMLWECQRRLRTSSPMVEKNLAPTEDHRMDWARNLGEDRVTTMFKLMQDHGLASTRTKGTSKNPHLILKLMVGWEALRQDLRRLQAGELPDESKMAPDERQRAAFLREALAKIQ
jgi:hypothetical protein